MRKSLLILLLATAFLLSACGVNNPNNLSTDYTLSGQVIGYTGGDATVEALWNDDSYGTGSIKANGTFSITLESNISNNRLTSLDAELSQDQTCSSLGGSSENSKGTVLPVLTLTKNSAVLGHIGQVSSASVMQALAKGTYNHPNAQAIGQTYVNQDADLAGECIEADMSINLKFKKGWNPVHIATDANTHTTLGNNGTNLNWHYLAQE
jgi:hypothetical protein